MRNVVVPFFTGHNIGLVKEGTKKMKKRKVLKSSLPFINPYRAEQAADKIQKNHSTRKNQRLETFFTVFKVFLEIRIIISKTSIGLSLAPYLIN